MDRSREAKRRLEDVGGVKKEGRGNWDSTGKGKGQGRGAGTGTGRGGGHGSFHRPS